MKVSDYIAALFVENNMKHMFSISGAGNVHLLNSIADNPALAPFTRTMAGAWPHWHTIVSVAGWG